MSTVLMSEGDWGVMVKRDSQQDNKFGQIGQRGTNLKDTHMRTHTLITAATHQVY